MEDLKLKHLEFIQAVIVRLSTNSFSLKGWCVALISALLALNASDPSKEQFAILALLILPVFWLMDGYYLCKERHFRKLYDKVRGSTKTDLSMDVKEFCSQWQWAEACTSKTLLPFYITMILVCILAIEFLGAING